MKLYFLIIAILITPLQGNAQNEMGELKGAITYKTANGRVYADAGAEVIIYLIDSVKSATDNYATHTEDSIINNSFLATIYYEEFQTSPIRKTQKQMVRKLKELNAYPEEQLHELDNLAAAIIRLRENKQCAKTNADQSGNYSVKLHPGYYGIIFRSRHLNSHTKAEIRGNIMLNDAVIKPGGTVIRNEEML